MKKIITLVVFIALVISGTAQKQMTKTGHAHFYSHTELEDIEANNYKVISSINPEDGSFVVSVPMQSFEFEKALMQKHYNSPKFLDTKQFPKATYKGKIKDLSNIDFTKDGSYEVEIEGQMTLHGETKTVTEKGTITIKGGKISASATFNLILADYKIAFEKGKPSTNIAKKIKITVNFNY